MSDYEPTNRSSQEDDALAFFASQMQEAVGSHSAPSSTPADDYDPPEHIAVDEADDGYDDDDRGVAHVANELSAVYKKWFRAGERKGFLTVEGFWSAEKVSFDVGETAKGELKSSTKVWSSIPELLTYLRAVRDGTAPKLYPERRDIPTAEGFITYGGAEVNGKLVSRILKIHQWTTKDANNNLKIDPNGFAVKAGHFAGRRNNTGAIIGDMTQCISANLIKVTRTEMHELCLRLEAKYQAAVNAQFVGRRL